MLKATVLNNYIKYLELLNHKLNKFFEQQKPYICCQRGCAKCCQTGEYPFSEMEFRLLQAGAAKLSSELQKEIADKILLIKAAKAQNNEKVFTYECPFLINNECSVYLYRGIICRTFGLMSIGAGNRPKIPFCAHEGLNYSNVLNKETDVISSELYKKLNLDVEPVAFNIDYEFLTGENIEQAYGFKFGEKKALIDWL